MSKTEQFLKDNGAGNNNCSCGYPSCQRYATEEETVEAYSGMFDNDPEQDYDAKAREIVGIFLPHVKNDNPPKPNSNYHAKQCAIIYCEGMIEEAKWWHETSSYEETTAYLGGLSRIKELESVLTAINKM